MMLARPPGRSIDIALQDAISASAGVDPTSIDKSRTQAVIIANYPVTEALANQFSQDESTRRKSGWVSSDAYKKIFSEDNARNLTVKFTCFNKDGKQNVFIASALVNDNECSVRFNGYLTVARAY
ncbi:hypothetical protein [Dryocola sp. BD586]|uniref:hypothetical protein n=1 Tax=Dryocola sp. BD586 TaxID=3133271 RepID=UPI003F5038AD